MEQQRTIAKSVTLSGIGLHTNKNINLVIKPAGINQGIKFKRVDLKGEPEIPAHISYTLDLKKSLRRTSIGKDGIEVHTIEHLMACFAALKIDNVIVEIDGEEVPGLDGSALPFLEALEDAAIVEQPAPRLIYQLKEPIWVEEKGASLTALPSNELKISYLLNYDHPTLKAQYINYVIDKEIFAKEIAPSRTFCLEEEVEPLRKIGLGKGADYSNTIVVGKAGVINNTFRFFDEPARHKVLDLIGDLYLLGCSIQANIIAIKSGHPLNIRLLRRIEQQRQRFLQAGIPVGELEHYQLPLEVTEIQKILPHRYPFLFIDRIVELEAGKRAVGIKNVSMNDYYFQGHFPGRPVMPGVLIVEAMAQTAGVLLLSQPEHRGKLAFFMGIDKVRFRRTVLPGDQLRLEVEVGKLRSKTGTVHTKALVDGKIVAEADLMFALVES